MTASTLDNAQVPTVGARNLWPLLPAGLAVFGASALVHYHTHPDEISSPPSALQSLVIGVYSFLGFAPGFMFAVLVLSWGSVWFFTSRVERIGGRAVRLLAFTVALAVLINLREVTAQPHTGALGWWIAERLASLFGPTVSTILMAPLAVALLILATDGFFYRYFEGMMRPADEPAAEALPAGWLGRPDVGVETEATEHLKSLATAAGPASFADVQAEVVASLQEPAVPPTFDDAASTDAVDPGAAAPSWRRSSRRSRWHDEDPAASDAEPVPPIEALPPPPAVEAPSAPAHPVVTPAEDEFTVAAASLHEGPGAAGSPPLPEAWTGDPDPVEVPIQVPRRGVLAPVVDDFGVDDVDDVANAVADQGPAPAAEPPAGLQDLSEPIAGVGDVDADPTPPAADRAVTAADPAASAGGTSGPLATVGETEAVVEPGAGLAEETAASGEPVVAIPRPSEGIRQQRLFVSATDSQLLEDAIELVTSSRRASASHLQRKLRIEYDQAMELLALLGRRGVIEIGDGETQGRVIGS